MTCSRLAAVVLSVTLLATRGGAAEEPLGSAFERIKALAGEWEGDARPGGAEKGMPTVAVYRVVSNGSAVMLVTDPGTPHEMVTMFHRDDGTLLATHYCAAMNQPRMRMAAPTKTPGRLEFDFVDGTNLKTVPGRMQRLVLTFEEGDRHRQEWTYRGGGQEQTMSFELRRKSAK